MYSLEVSTAGFFRVRLGFVGAGTTFSFASSSTGATDGPSGLGDLGFAPGIGGNSHLFFESRHGTQARRERTERLSFELDLLGSG